MQQNHKWKATKNNQQHFWLGCQNGSNFVTPKIHFCHQMQLLFVLNKNKCIMYALLYSLYTYLIKGLIDNVYSLSLSLYRLSLWLFVFLDTVSTWNILFEDTVSSEMEAHWLLMITSYLPLILIPYRINVQP